MNVYKGQLRSPPPSPLSSSSPRSSHDHLLGNKDDDSVAVKDSGSRTRSIRMMQRTTSARSNDKQDSLGERSATSKLGHEEPALADRAKAKNDDDAQPWGAVATVKPTGNAERASRDSDMNIDDLFDPTRSAKENKSFLMSYELDRMQFGRYQLFVFFLCGMGFFIDLMWAQALGLIATPLKYEPGFGAGDDISTLSVAFNVGLTVGAFTWGIMVDVIGRRWSFYFTCLISGIFGVGSGGSNSFLTLRVLTAFIGFGVGGNIPIDATITMETLPTNRRFLLVLLSLFQPVGVLVACGIAYGYIPKFTCASMSDCLASDNMGWRYFLYTLGAITIAIFLLRFVVFHFHESPAFLINTGRDREALKAVNAIAKINRAPPPQFTLEDFAEIDRRCAVLRTNQGIDEQEMQQQQLDESAGGPLQRESFAQTFSRTGRTAIRQYKNLRILFRSRTMARVTIMLWLTYIADFWGFNIAGFYLPQILADRGVEGDTSLSDTYRDYVIIYAPGIAACLLGGLMVEIPRLGRQWSMIISSALMAVSMFLYTIVTTQAGSVGLNLLEYFMQSLFNAILYAYTPEAYPSAIRGTAAGFTSTLGRVSGIVAPIAGGSLYDSTQSAEEKIQATKNILYLGGGMTLLCPVALALLPFDTRGKRSY